MGNLLKSISTLSNAKQYLKFTATQFKPDTSAVSFIRKIFLPKAKAGTNVPRFLYTFTSLDNYNSIMNSGTIRTSTDLVSNGNIKGVFMVSMENLCKRWIPSSKDWGGGSLATALFNNVAKKGKGLVCIKIPTTALDKEKILIRSQNEYFKAKKSLGPYDIGHVRHGASARYHTFFEQRKHAIEYIYPDEIPAEIIQSARTVDVSEIYRSVPCGKNAPAVANLRVLNALFKDMPESNLLAHIPEPKIIPL